MATPILILNAAAIGLAAGGIIGALGYGWIRQRWALMGSFAVISLLFAVFSTFELFRRQTADLGQWIYLARWEYSCAICLLAFMPFLFRLLYDSRPAWPDYAFAGWYLVVFIINSFRPGGIGWDRVTSLVSYDLGWFGTDAFVQGRRSAFFPICQTVNLLNSIYCMGLVWKGWRVHRHGLLAAGLVPPTIGFLVVYNVGRLHHWWAGPGIEEFGVLALYLGLGSVIIQRERGFARERERLLEEHAENEAFRKRMFEELRVPVAVMDAQTGVVLDCNPAAVEIYGFSSRAEMLGKTPAEVSPPTQYDGTPSPEKAGFFIAQALAKGAVVFPWRQQRPDGQVWDAEVHLMSFQSGRRKLLQFTVQDITARRLAESRVRQQAALIEATHDAILVCHLAKGLEFMNPAAEKLCGRTLSEVRSLKLEEVLKTKTPLELQVATRKVLENGVWTGELSLLGKQGEILNVAR